eukprot:15470814-Alexandrium_andersonii.AAC.1
MPRTKTHPISVCDAVCGPATGHDRGIGLEVAAFGRFQRPFTHRSLPPRPFAHTPWCRIVVRHCLATATLHGLSMGDPRKSCWLPVTCRPSCADPRRLLHKVWPACGHKAACNGKVRHSELLACTLLTSCATGSSQMLRNGSPSGRPSTM